MTLFVEGQPFLGSAIGFRIHGNTSRLHIRKNYRVITRGIYGAESFPGEIIGLPEGGSGVNEWVLRRDIQTDSEGHPFPFVTALAWDVSRQVGALAPHGRTVSFRLNGKDEGIYVLGERIEEGFLERRLGPGPWEISNLKVDRQMSPWLWQLTQPDSEGLPHIIPLARLESEFDLDSLIRWHLAITLCLTADTDQATMIRRPGEPWQWVIWDMDHSFRLVRPQGRKSWEVDRLQAIQINGANQRSLTGRLLWTLLSGNPSFRERYAAIGNDILDRHFTAAFVEDRLAYYSRLANELGVEDRQFLKELRLFLEHRPEAVRRHLERLLVEDPLTTKVANPS